MMDDNIGSLSLYEEVDGNVSGKKKKRKKRKRYIEEDEAIEDTLENPINTLSPSQPSSSSSSSSSSPLPPPSLRTILVAASSKLPENDDRRNRAPIVQRGLPVICDLDNPGTVRKYLPSGEKACRHGRSKKKCKECGSKSICSHGRQKTDCKECKGKSICEHNRKKNQCIDCVGASICRHMKRRSQCRICSPHNFCMECRKRNYICRKAGKCNNLIELCRSYTYTTVMVSISPIQFLIHLYMIHVLFLKENVKRQCPMWNFTDISSLLCLHRNVA